MRNQQVTHVEGIIFYVRGSHIWLCFVLPVAALEAGRKNHTLPGGRIHQLGRHRRESVIDAMMRELQEETGTPGSAIRDLSMIGEPIEHLTAKREPKLVQGFVGVVTEQTVQPRLPQEIAEVRWHQVSEWHQLLATMNPGKQVLVLELLRQALFFRGLFPCIKRNIKVFLSEQSSKAIVLHA